MRIFKWVQYTKLNLRLIENNNFVMSHTSWILCSFTEINKRCLILKLNKKMSYFMMMIIGTQTIDTFANDMFCNV